MDSTVVVVTAPPSTYAMPTGASGTANIEFPPQGPASYGINKRYLDEVHRRGLCDWVTATMRGTPAVWRNNWNGMKAINCDTYLPTPGPTPPSTPAQANPATTSKLSKDWEDLADF